MNDCILEVCVDSLVSARNAILGGANRLELCENLIIGGTTPSLALFSQIRRESNIPIHVLIRPRFGDFLYHQSEVESMLYAIDEFKKAGADAIVIGALNADGSLDLDSMKSMITAAGDLKITLHRAFDVCKDAFLTLEEAKSLGIHTILTSGQKNNCMEGLPLIKQLVEVSSPISILVGSGVNSSNLLKIREKTNANAFHMSGKTKIESKMIYRNPAVFMGLDGLSEYESWVTDVEEIKKARELIEKMK